VRDHVKLALPRASIDSVHENIQRCASDEQQARENSGGHDWTRVSGEKRFERRTQNQTCTMSKTAISAIAPSIATIPRRRFVGSRSSISIDLHADCNKLSTLSLQYDLP